MALTPEQLAKITNLEQLQLLAQRTNAKFVALDAEVVKSVTVAKDATATTGYAASYTISVNNTPLATKIDIPKDFLVKSATLETVTTADVPYAGAVVGDKYIDFVINAKDASETAEHIYLPVNDLVDAYNAGNGLALDSSTNTFSVTVDTANANGLSVGANGLALAPVTASTSGAGGTNGAMLATDKEKLNGIAEQATKAEVTTEKAGTITINGTSKTIVEFATNAEVTEMLDAALPAPSSN